MNSAADLHPRYAGVIPRGTSSGFWSPLFRSLNALLKSSILDEYVRLILLI